MGLWVPSLVPPAAAFLIALMLGALAMHRRIGDAAKKSLPAFFMLALSGTLLATALA